MMVRFARAQGSKASNARVPEEATSWSEMKQQLVESTSRKDREDSPSRIAKLTSSFYSPDESSPLVTGGDWAEFETNDVSSEKNKKVKSKKSSKKEKADKDLLHVVHEDGKVKKKKKKNEIKMDSSQVQQVAADTEDINTVTLSKSQKRKQKKKEKYSLKDPQEQQEKKTEETGQTLNVKKRRKPVKQNRTLIIDGRKVEIENYDNFPVMKEDADRLKELKKKMLSQGIPKDEIQRAMKLERRRAEKRLYREGRKLCFHCRKSGHLMSDCPKLGQETCTVCFKCGSTEHKSTQCHVTQGNDYKFGTCFVCGEQGHIARQCPDNPRGLYPQGGGCKICGDVTHLKKDCPQLAEERKDNAITLSTTNDTSAVEALEEDSLQKEKPKAPITAKKIVKF